MKILGIELKLKWEIQPERLPFVMFDKVAKKVIGLSISQLQSIIEVRKFGYSKIIRQNLVTKTNISLVLGK